MRSQKALARLKERHGQTAQAVELYQAIMRETPSDPQPHHRLAVIAARQGRFADAEQHFRTAQSMGPPCAELLSDLGYMYYLQHRLPEAEEVLRKAKRLEPHSEAVGNNLGLVLGAQGRYDESLATFRQVVDEAEAYANLAYVFTQRGELDQAQTHFSRALTLNNTLRPAAQAMIQVAERQKQQHMLTTGVTSQSDNRPPAETGRHEPPTQGQLAKAHPAAGSVDRRPAQASVESTAVVARPQPRPPATHRPTPPSRPPAPPAGALARADRQSAPAPNGRTDGTSDRRDPLPPPMVVAASGGRPTAEASRPRTSSRRAGAERPARQAVPKQQTAPTRQAKPVARLAQGSNQNARRTSRPDLPAGNRATAVTPTSTNAQPATAATKVAAHATSRPGAEPPAQKGLRRLPGAREVIVVGHQATETDRSDAAYPNTGAKAVYLQESADAPERHTTDRVVVAFRSDPEVSPTKNVRPVRHDAVRRGTAEASPNPTATGLVRVHTTDARGKTRADLGKFFASRVDDSLRQAAENESESANPIGRFFSAAEGPPATEEPETSGNASPIGQFFSLAAESPEGTPPPRDESETRSIRGYFQ
jgi:Flp pilus assembly protein TadD